ncbi:MAG: cytochrome c oxidase assembly protein [Sutterellaceae bacterium]|nr:cytochrome c oxidase assembly protein [Burkholderiaceae bacterium]MCX7901272.1 cytochrome c oxidase assembly protein [Burkholderiaceae bacterium]MDW8429422.1 cytochrome c oxidase assembly protein [Sutterellaceae bacterium]
MSRREPAHPPERAASNLRLLHKLLFVAVLMFGFGWALIPIYRKICEMTGINLLTDPDPRAAERVRNTQVDVSRTVVVEFDANKQGPWRFQPSVSHLTVHPGELVRVDYDLVNLENRTLAGQAIPSYAPLQAARYFNKLECFCFQQQTLAAGESRRFPVVFVIDPQLPRDVAQITLSYTFFEVPGAAPAGVGPRS